MKTIKELLELMLENQNLFMGGLCIWVWILFDEGLINDDEKKFLRDFIKKNRKTPILSIQDYWYKRSGDYYWKEGKITPRIHWIKYQIKQLN